MKFRKAIGISISKPTITGSVLQYCSVCSTESDGNVEFVCPKSQSLQRNWTYDSLFGWIRSVTNNVPAIVGIDFPFSFPKAYLKEFDDSCDVKEIAERVANGEIHENTGNFSIYRLKEEDLTADGIDSGINTWQRLTECKRFPKFVFLPGKPEEVPNDTQGQILGHWTLKREFWELRSEKIHLWPFDGWEVLEGRSCLVEAYPPVQSVICSSEDRTNYHEQSAREIASWLWSIVQNERIVSMLNPNLPDDVRNSAMKEGWILGEEWDSFDSNSVNENIDESAAPISEENCNFLQKIIQFLCKYAKRG